MAKWMLLLVTLAGTSTASSLPECGPGTFLSKGRCESCPKGTYTDKYSRAKFCTPYSVCKEGEEIIRQGTDRSDTVCQCLDGERDYAVYDYPLLDYRCKKCRQGTSAKRVIDGYSGDTVCCLNGKVPRRDGSGKAKCYPHSPAQNPSPTHPSNSQATPADAQSTPQNNGAHTGKNFDGWRFDVGSFLIGAAVIAVVAAVAIVCICLRLKKHKAYNVYKTMGQFFTRKSRQQSPDGQGASEGLRQQPDPQSCV